MDQVPPEERDVATMLTAAFRAETAGLEYAGQAPTLRRTQPWRVALPAAAAVGVAATIAVVATQAGGPAGGDSRVVPTRPSDTQEVASMITERLELEGAELVYQRPATDRPGRCSKTSRPGCRLQVRAIRVDLGRTRMPPDATRVEIPGTRRAWIAQVGHGRDLGLFLQLRGSQGLASTATLLSPGATRQQLTRLAESTDMRVVVE